MNIEEYISSGIVEVYVLDTATEQEVREVEMYARQYPEIKQGIDEARIAMEQFAMAHSKVPRAGLKEEIWEAIAGQDNEIKKIPFEDESARAQNITPLIKERSPFLTILAAASVLLLLGSAILNIILWKNNSKNEERLATIEKSQENLSREAEDQENAIAGYRRYFSLIQNPDVRVVKMAGVGDHKSNEATVLWDSNTKELFLSLNNLPEPPSGSQYQLWAIVDGKPVDAGVFDINENLPVQKMKVMTAAQMFAVTLEKAGGSPTPTMEQMYVAGKI